MSRFKNVIAKYDGEDFDFELEAMDGEIGVKSASGLSSLRDLTSEEIETLNNENSEWLRALWGNV
jgi:hypothetical protein